MNPTDTIQELRARLAQCEADLQRSAKVQAALYKVAEAASSAADLQEFYKSLHEIIAGLMYAGNFFIATLDHDAGMLSWPYHLDEKDVVGTKNWTPELYREGKPRPRMFCVPAGVFMPQRRTRR